MWSKRHRFNSAATEMPRRSLQTLPCAPRHPCTIHLAAVCMNLCITGYHFPHPTIPGFWLPAGTANTPHTQGEPHLFPSTTNALPKGMRKNGGGRRRVKGAFGGLGMTGASTPPLAPEVPLPACVCMWGGLFQERGRRRSEPIYSYKSPSQRG